MRLKDIEKNHFKGAVRAMSMFKKVFVKEKEERGNTSTDFAKLLNDAKFISDNLKKLDFVLGAMFARKALHGTIYLSNMNFNLSDVDNMDTFIQKAGTIEMLNLFTDKANFQVYQREYKCHTVTKTYIEVELCDGKSKKLYFS